MSPAERRCPTCGALASPDAEWCGQCFAPLNRRAETSAAVLQRLGVRALAVGDEIAPGVPWMTSLGEPRLVVALKSGNFGGPDFFSAAFALLEGEAT